MSLLWPAGRNGLPLVTITDLPHNELPLSRHSDVGSRKPGAAALLTDRTNAVNIPAQERTHCEQQRLRPSSLNEGSAAVSVGAARGSPQTDDAE